jgi:hypothetical protein
VLVAAAALDEARFSRTIESGITHSSLVNVTLLYDDWELESVSTYRKFLQREHVTASGGKSHRVFRRLQCWHARVRRCFGMMDSQRHPFVFDGRTDYKPRMFRRRIMMRADATRRQQTPIRGAGARQAHLNIGRSDPIARSRRSETSCSLGGLCSILPQHVQKTTKEHSMSRPVPIPCHLTQANTISFECCGQRTGSSSVSYSITAVSGDAVPQHDHQ